MIRKNCHVKVNKVAAILDNSHSSAHHTMHNMMQFDKVSVRWLPRHLTPKLEERCVNAYQQLLQQYKTEDHGFLKCIVIGDENWVHYYHSAMKWASKE
jgi:hypothetical protein